MGKSKFKISDWLRRDRNENLQGLLRDKDNMLYVLAVRGCLQTMREEALKEIEQGSISKNKVHSKCTITVI